MATKKKYRQTGRSKKSADIKRKAKPPGKRKSSSGRTYFENRKNRSDIPGKLTGMTATQLTSELKRRINDNIDKLVVKKFRETTKRGKKQLQKKITEYKAQLRKLL